MDRPGLGPAMVASEIGSMLIPGGAATRGTRAAAEAADVPDAGPGVRAADNAATNAAGIAQRGSAIESNLDDLGDNISTGAMPEASGPPIPKDVVNAPSTPQIPESPGTPRLPDSPAPHVPDPPKTAAPEPAPVDRSSPAPHSSAPVDRSPEPHTPTPAATPAHAPLDTAPDPRVPAGVNGPSPSHQSAPAPSSSPVPTGAAPPASHAPEAPPSAPAHETRATVADSQSLPGGDTPHEAASVGDNSRDHSPSDAGATSHDATGKPDDQLSQPDATHHSNNADHADHDRSFEDEFRDMRPWDQERVERATTPGQLEHDLRESGCPPEIAASAADNPYAGMSAHDLLERHWNPEEHTWRWPPENGFKDGVWSVTDRIPEEVRVDRIGVVSDRAGDFMGAEGDLYPSRSLAPGTSGDYNVFEGTNKPLPAAWQVRYGEVGEAFDQPGGGTQWVVVDEYGETVLIHTLVENGYLRPVSGPVFDIWKKAEGEP